MRFFQLFILLLYSVSTWSWPLTHPLGVNDKLTNKVNRTLELSNISLENGTPFFTESYKYCDIILKNGRIFKSIQARLNLVTQEVNFISVNGIQAFMEKGTVKEISYADTTEAGIVQYKFKTGFVSMIDKSTDNFYLVLADGNYTFLKSITKKVTEKRNELTHEVNKEFETYEDYFFYTKGEMKRWKKDKNFVMAELSDKQQQINQYIISHNINFRNQNDIIKLLAYYNSL